MMNGTKNGAQSRTAILAYASIVVGCLLISAGAHQVSPEAALTWFLQATAIAVIGSFTPPTRLFGAALVALLAAALAASAINDWGLARSWHERGAAVVRSLLAADEIVGGGRVQRQWLLADGKMDFITVNLSGRVDAKPEAWLFGPASETHTSPVSAAGFGETRFAPTSKAVYIVKRAELPEPIGTSPIRVRLATRAESAGSPVCGGINLATPGGGYFTRAELCMTDEWSVHELMWTPPYDPEVRNVDVVLNGFGPSVVLVRDVAVERSFEHGWQELGPLIPSVPYLSISVSRPAEVRSATHHTPFRPSDTTAYSATWTWPVELPSNSNNDIVATISNPLSSTLRVSATQADGYGMVPTLRSPLRAQAFFGHPNTMGHVVAAAGLALLLLHITAHIHIPVTAILLVAAIATAVTGSRAGLVALTAGASAMLLIGSVRAGAHRWRVPKVRLLIVMPTVVAVAIWLWVRTDRLGQLSLPNTVSRLEIWSATLRWTWPPTWEALGLSRWQVAWAEGTTGVLVMHPHNMLLTMVVEAGLLGVIAFVLVTAGFVLLGMATQAPRLATLFVVTVAVGLQSIDFTLFNWAVMTVTLGLLNVLRKPDEHLTQCRDMKPNPRGCCQGQRAIANRTEA